MKNLIISSCILVITMQISTCSKNINTDVKNSDSVSTIDTLPKCDSVGLVNTPLNVSWVQKVIAGRDCEFVLPGAKLSTCIYKNKMVVYFTNPASNLGICQAIVYNCNGTILARWMQPGWVDIEQNLQNQKVFWSK